MKTAPNTITIGEIPRLELLRKDLLAAPYELCTQKSRLLTRYFREHGPRPKKPSLPAKLHYGAYTRALSKQTRGHGVSPFRNRINNQLMAIYKRSIAKSCGETQIHFAKAFDSILENMELRVYNHELIVGNCSSKRIGAPIHADFGGVLMQPEIHALATRSQNPIGTNAEQLRELDNEIFPYWFNKSVLAHAPAFANNKNLTRELSEGDAYILTQIAGISHVTPDYEEVLRRGFEGIADRIKASILEHESAKLKKPLEWLEQDEDRLLYYRAELIAAEAAIAYGRRWQRFLLAESEHTRDPHRKKELGELAGLFEVVPGRPAATFHQALQSLFITHAMVHQESFQHGVSFGRLDQILLPFYRRDIETGSITPTLAVELIGCFLCKAAELVPLFFDLATEYFSGLSSASGITLAGTIGVKQDGVNELSYLFLEAHDRVRLRQPNLHVRVHQGTPDAFMATCARVLKNGGGLPAFFSDEEIMPALMARGVPEADAGNYAVVGCAEWGVPGKSFPAAGAAFVNLPLLLSQALKDAATGKAPRNIAGMGELLDRVKTRLKDVLARVADGNNAIEAAHAQFRPTPFLSLLVQGCLAKGSDVTRGGACYNSSGIQGVGLADMVDSLIAIDQLVFKEKRLTCAALSHVLENNFEGQDDLRARILEKSPRFGHGEAAGRNYASQVSSLFIDEVSQLPHFRGGTYEAGFWSMTTHQGFGKRTGALPSGRKANQPLANGGSPQTGSEALGPTAAMASVAAVQTPGNGLVFNQKLSRGFLSGQKGSQILVGLVRGFFAAGGAQIQFNILDADILQKAKRNPELYRDLVVRISGYSAYFRDLTDEMQEELILRALHEG